MLGSFDLDWIALPSGMSWDCNFNVVRVVILRSEITKDFSGKISGN